VTLTEFYESVDVLVAEMRSAGFGEDAQRIEDAERGGATSGEVLGRLRAVLATVHAPRFQERISLAVRFIDDTLGPLA
jgi:hypothetical protein